MLSRVKNFICDVTFCYSGIVLECPIDAGEQWDSRGTVNEVCGGLSRVFGC